MNVNGTLSVVTCAVLFLSGCGKKGNETVEETGTDSPFLMALETAPPAPQMPPLPAPEGVFFLTEYVSIQKDHGVIGLSPGTTVSLVKQKPSTLVVKYQDKTIELKPEQLTNDIHHAEWLFHVDQVNQRNLVRGNKLQRDFLLREQAQRRQAFEQSLQETVQNRRSREEEAPVPAKTTGHADTRLQRQPYNPSPGSPTHIGAETDGRRFWVDPNGEKHYFYYPPAETLPPAPAPTE